MRRSRRNRRRFTITGMGQIGWLTLMLGLLTTPPLSGQTAAERIRQTARPGLERRAELSPVPMLVAERESLGLNDEQVARLERIQAGLLGRNARILEAWRESEENRSPYTAVAEAVARLTESYKTALRETTEVLDARQREEARRIRLRAMREVRGG